MVWTGSTSIGGSSKLTVGGVTLETLGREALPGFCFLGPQRLGRSSKSTALDIDLDFLFPVRTEVTWTTGGAVGGAVTSSSLLVMVFSLFSLIVVIPTTRKVKF